MSDSKVYLYFVIKRRQARRRIPRNSCVSSRLLNINVSLFVNKYGIYGVDLGELTDS